MQELSRKLALITGGASGIGRALGERLARSGARVVLADRHAEAAEQAAAGIRAAGGSATSAELDVTDAARFAAVVARLAASEGEIDYLFNNAGVAVAGEVRFMQLADWDRLVDVNVRGVVHGIAAVYPRMVARRSGHIVNTASAAGLLPVPGMAIYAMTKHAVVGLSTSLRAEARRHGVRVSAVCPGFVRTPLLDTTPMVRVDRARALRGLPLASIDGCVEAIVRGVLRDRAIIAYTPLARVGWLLYRLVPELTVNLMARGASRNPMLASAAGD